MCKSSEKFDVHQEITNRIVDALETTGEFQLPCIRNKGGSFARPVNIASKNPYNGANIVSLWESAQAHDYPSNLWGTYRQCRIRDSGSQRRKIIARDFLQDAFLRTAEARRALAPNDITEYEIQTRKLSL